ncbi:hypothetical protein AB447_222660 [Bacillus glycinifermentans]|uniref:Uncharacterized protein n=1 Tax=Bacillus glycinifermentans TaxID=1664069 RepID=A0A0T6BMP5_9BACI|nr:hypothetical protein AB447_222660 [Bacillus glycinifermentans]
MKYNGYIMRNRLNDHQSGSKSPLNSQKAIACRPEQNVNTRETRAALFHNGRFFLCKYKLASPLIEIKISSGKNDQFQAMTTGSS